MFLQSGIFSGGFFANIAGSFKASPVTFLIALFILASLAIIFVFLIWLVVVSQAAIVAASAKILTGKKADFNIGIASGIKNFWPVFGMNVALKISTMLIFAIMTLPITFAVFAAGNATYSLLYFIAFLLFIPIAFSLSFIIKYAISYVVLKEKRFMEAAAHGWKLFIDNWLISLEMGAALFLINFFATFLFLAALFLLAIPFTFIAYIIIQAASYVVYVLYLGMIFILLMVVVVLFGSVLSTFYVSSWTALFVELVSRGGTSKLVRLTDNWRIGK